MGDPEKISPKVSKLFNAPDSDVTIQSSDGTLFKVHKKYLELATGGFPPAEMETRNEIVVLTEPATILELLFQVIYPQRNPDLGSIKFDNLLVLAEAAEKYEVYGAIHMCMLTMERTLPDHVGEVLAYAAKHKYHSVLDRVAPLALALPPESIADLLTPDVIVPWFRYYGKACQVLFDAIAKIDDNHSGVMSTPVTINDRCSSWNTLNSKKILVELGKGPKILLELDALVSAERVEEWRRIGRWVTCGYADCSCKVKAVHWKAWVYSRFNGMEKFSACIP